MKGDPFEEIFFEKSHNAEKPERDPLVSPGTVCYVEEQEKPFWFNSLGQMVQFETIKFCRIMNYFGQFVWIEKATIIVAFHFMKRRLKLIRSKGGSSFTFGKFSAWKKRFENSDDLLLGFSTLSDFLEINNSLGIFFKNWDFCCFGYYNRLTKSNGNKPGTAQVCARSRSKKAKCFEYAKEHYKENPLLFLKYCCSDVVTTQKWFTRHQYKSRLSFKKLQNGHLLKIVKFAEPNFPQKNVPLHHKRNK